MTKEEYAEQLKDPRWVIKRNKILVRDKHKCAFCKSKKLLQVHHLYYVKGNTAWDLPNSALITLCNKCHINWHEYNKLVFKEAIFIRSKDHPEYKSPVKPKKPKTKKAKQVARKRLKFVTLPTSLSQCNIPKEFHQQISGIYRKSNDKEKTVLVKALYIQYGRIK